jgi:tRNA-binding protein
MSDRESACPAAVAPAGGAPTYEQFRTLDIRVGTVVYAEPNAAARRPAYIVKIDFGPDLGVMTSSAQITEHYDPASLVGTQLVAVTNFPTKRIAGVKSEVLLLAAVTENGSVLLRPDLAVADGCRVY